MLKTYTRTYNDQGNLVALTQNEMNTRGRRMYRRAIIKEYIKGLSIIIFGFTVLVLLALAIK